MERRRTPRLFLNRAVYLTEGRLGTSGTLFNLSQGGCAVECGRGVRADEQLSLHLVLSEEEPAICIEEAKVRWVTEGRFGVEFLTMSADARDQLHRFLQARLDAGIVVELRRHRRFCVRLPVAFWGDGVTGLGHVVNVSKGGCAVESEVVPARGTSLQLYMTMPVRQSSFVVEVAPVRWSRDTSFGVEFMHMQPEAQEVLQHVVARLVPEQGPSST